jgi:DNA-binding NarL/FixJ family response regulator
MLVDSAEAFCCVAAYGTAEEALAAIPAEAPDVLLMDINLPRMSGVECVRRVKMACPDLLVIMLTVYDDGDQIFGALQAGASGYLLKRTPPEGILNAIQEVLQGGAPMSSYIARKVVHSFQANGASQKSNIQLTEREAQVLAYVAKGYINKEIACALSVSLETVRSHLKNVYEKLHVRSRTEAAMRFFQKDSHPL